MAIELKNPKYQYRFLARIVIEASTPLAVGTGVKDIITDALVAKDVNGLPYIPGTSIAGVVRSMLKQTDIDTDKFFGYQDRTDGEGSKIIFTEGKIIDSENKVIDGLNLDAIKNDILLKNYIELPIRQHVRINHKGVTDKTGKFDNQIVFAGTRFCFEIEMVAKQFDQKIFENALSQIKNKAFRLGSGSRKGYGEIEVIDLQSKTLDLTKTDDLKQYLEKSSALNANGFWNIVYSKPKKEDTPNWTEITLNIRPDDFFMFGSGMGSDDGNADMTPVRARKVSWNIDDTFKMFSDKYVLIPASSVKGAISHRVAFHYNKNTNATIENGRWTVGDDNPAVQSLFGYMKDGEPVKPGSVLISDVFEPEPNWKDIAKLINHVAIDRFTGGAIDGALFTEQTLYKKGQNFAIKLLVNKTAFEDKEVKKAFFDTLDDICNGLLPLGGGVNRGNGIFSGSYELKEKEVEK